MWVTGKTVALCEKVERAGIEKAMTRGRKKMMKIRMMTQSVFRLC